MIKRAFDVAASALALLLLCPLFLLVALAIKLDSAGPALFKQTRVGRHFRSFTIYKFRTMSANAAGREITVGADPRITRVGRFLRQAKIDELPQLVNILRGDMTFVGPRPEVPAYVDLFRADYEELLQVRPGLTDLASLKYRDESAILACAENPEVEYLARLLPDKIRLSKEYLRRSCFTYDLALILETFRQVWTPRRIA
jgi:lipopolysaccharide/colanic/teichoic acid biosynthesis glycosyltransferase